MPVRFSRPRTSAGPTGIGVRARPPGGGRVASSPPVACHQRHEDSDRHADRLSPADGLRHTGDDGAVGPASASSAGTDLYANANCHTDGDGHNPAQLHADADCHTGSADRGQRARGR